MSFLPVDEEVYLAVAGVAELPGQRVGPVSAGRARCRHYFSVSDLLHILEEPAFVDLMAVPLHLPVVGNFLCSLQPLQPEPPAVDMLSFDDSQDHASLVPGSGRIMVADSVTLWQTPPNSAQFHKYSHDGPHELNLAVTLGDSSLVAT